MAKLCNTPQAIAPIQLQPCDSCGRKFNLEALQRHIKVKSVMITRMARMILTIKLITMMTDMILVKQTDEQTKPKMSI